MLDPSRPSERSFHYISPSSPSPYYLLLLDITRALDALESCKTQLLDSPFSTSNGEYIRPVECDQVMEVSRSIRETGTRLSGKLGLIGSLHGLSGTTYYKLNMYLHSASGKSKKLEGLLMQFRPICMQNSSQQRETFARVQGAIRMCMQVCEQVREETEAVLDTILLNTNPIPEYSPDLLQKENQPVRQAG
jgi:hypothetical protein